MDYPHTTEIIKPFADYSHIPEGALEHGAARHRSYAACLMGLWAPPLPAEDEGQFTSFRKWADKYIRKIVLVEQSLMDKKNGYTGTIDFLGFIQTHSEDFCAVIDWKPPGAGGPIIRAQIASYINLAKVNGFPVNKGGFLRMDPAGGVAKMEWIEVGGVDFCGFLAALSTYRYFKS